MGSCYGSGKIGGRARAHIASLRETVVAIRDVQFFSKLMGFFPIRKANSILVLRQRSSGS